LKFRPEGGPLRGRSSGHTLFELLVSMAILGILFALGAAFLIYISRFMAINRARLELQRDARASMSSMEFTVHTASATTVEISNVGANPIFSQVIFQRVKRDGSLGWVTYFQDGQRLRLRFSAAKPTAPFVPAVTFSPNLESLIFAAPDSSDPKTLTLSMSFQKRTYGDNKKTFQLTAHKIRMMN
jgi:prepilin-type N-terminal cleavage/methylation domain-containing protein